MLVLESLFNKVVGLKVCNFIKKRLQHRCFSVNIVNFLRTALFIEHFWWVFLKKLFIRSLVLFMLWQGTFPISVFFKLRRKKEVLCAFALCSDNLVYCHVFTIENKICQIFILMIISFCNIKYTCAVIGKRCEGYMLNIKNKQDKSSK